MPLESSLKNIDVSKLSLSTITELKKVPTPDFGIRMHAVPEIVVAGDTQTTCAIRILTPRYSDDLVAMEGVHFRNSSPRL